MCLCENKSVPCIGPLVVMPILMVKAESQQFCLDETSRYSQRMAACSHRG